MDILFIALAAIGLLIVLQVIRLYAAVAGTTGIQVKNASYELRATDDLPAYLGNLAKVYEEELSDLGFKPSHCQLVDGPFSPAHPKWQSVYLNATQRTYAILTIPTLPDQTTPCRVEFETLFSDNKSLNTVNGLSHMIVGQLPDTTLLDPCATTVEGQLTAHLAALSELKAEKTPIILTPAEFVAAARQSSDKYVSQLRTDGLVRPQDNHYALRWTTAIRYACRFLIGNIRAKRVRRHRDKSTMYESDVPVEVEVKAFRRITSQNPEPKRMKWIGKTVLLLGTLLLFALSLGFSMSFSFLAVLILALLIHELGHVLGMYLFNYRDPTILFLPFLGAVATGLPENARPRQKVIVLLLGPVPGLILGVTCWILYGFTRSELVRDAAITLFALNYFNLLPIMPLDGGQIVNLFLFSKFPLVQGVFQVVSLILLAAISLCSGAYVLLVVSVYGLFAVPRLFQRGKLLNKLRKRIRGMDRVLSEDDVLREIYRLMREKPFDRWPFAARYQMAKYAVDNLNIEFPSWRTVVLSLSTYVALLVLPVFAFAIVGFVAVVQSRSGSGLWQSFSPSWPEPVLQQPLGHGDTLALSRMGSLANADLYLIDDVNGLRPVVESKGYKTGLAWSPDGTRFVYTLYDKGYAYYVVDVDREDQHQIPVDSECYIRMLRWSPDGSRLAGVAYDYSDDAAFGVSFLYIFEAATDEMLELSMEAEGVEDFVWMSDSQSLLTIVRTDGSTAVRVYGIDGSHERPPVDATHLNDATRLTLSPDASKVAYTIPSEDNEAWTVPLYVSTLDGSSAKTVGSLSWDGEIAWSPDSTRIAFVTMDDSHNNALCVVNSDGTELRQLMLLDTGDESGGIMPPAPAWSPDGARIAISSHISADGSAIFVVNADGSEQRQITNASGWVYDLAWQPRE